MQRNVISSDVFPGIYLGLDIRVLGDVAGTVLYPSYVMQYVSEVETLHLLARRCRMQRINRLLETPSNLI